MKKLFHKRDLDEIKRVCNWDGPVSFECCVFLAGAVINATLNIIHNVRISDPMLNSYANSINCILPRLLNEHYIGF